MWYLSDFKKLTDDFCNETLGGLMHKTATKSSLNLVKIVERQKSVI